ncbi:MAG: ComEC/Rec2 family competence protein [Planctomycetota bacterium]
MERSAPAEGRDPPARPHRPLAWLATALALGSGLGLEARDAGLGLRTAGLWAGALLAASPAAGFARRVLLRHRGIPPRAGVPVRRGPRRTLPGALAVLVLAFLRGAATSGPPLAPGPERVALAREETLRGRWRPWQGGQRGWLEVGEGGESPAAGILFACAGPPPEPGAWIAILPGPPPVPWPRGPVPGPSAAPGRFAATAELLPDEWLRIAPPPRSPGGGALGRLRDLLRRRLAHREIEGPRRGLLSALVLGAQEDTHPALRDLFTRTGTRHLLAVSGLNVVLVAALVLLPAALVLGRGVGRQRPRAARILAILLPCPFLVAYAGLAGAAAPVVRATLAVSLGLLAPLARRPSPHLPPRRPDPLSLWCAALALECLADPEAVRSIAVRLSYLATLGLIAGTAPFLRLLAPPPREAVDLASPHPVRLVLRIAGTRLSRAGRGALAASLAAVLATLPAIWSTFAEVAPAGVLATPLAVLPLIPLLLGGWALALAPDLVDPHWLEPFGALLQALLEAADRLPDTPSPLPPRPAPLLWLATLAAFAVLAGTAPPRLAGCLRRATAALWALLLLPWSAAPAGLELHVLDVGHGLCAVARAPGLSALVFDAGSRDRRRVADEALLPLLRRWEASRPLVVVSHDQLDHTSALGWLVERIPPGGWIGARPARLGERFSHSLLRADPAPGRLRLGGGAGGSLSIEVVRGRADAGNEGSRSLVLRLGKDLVVLAGDAEGEGLAEALAGELLPSPVRLLLAPHHGSDTPELSALLARVRPQEVWISSGAPPEIGPELDRRDIPWRWTGRDGPLALFLPESGSGWSGGNPGLSGAAEPSPRPSAPPAILLPSGPEPAGERQPRETGNRPRRSSYSSSSPGSTAMRCSPPPALLLRALLPLLAGGLLLLPAPAAQDEVPTAGVPASLRPAGGPGEASILHLADGRVLRARARAVEGGWEVREGREWRLLPSSLVTRAAREKEVLAQARRLERELSGEGEEDLGRRVAWSDWCFAEGLHAEALRALDRVLAAAPDHPLAREVLRRRNVPLSLPPLAPGASAAERDLFLAAAAKLPPAAREIAVLRIDAAREVFGLPEALRERLLSASPRDREFAAHALRRLLPGAEVQALLGRAILDSSREVRREASLALRDVGDPAVAVPAIRALGSKRALVRENAVQALGAMGYRAAVEPLVRHLLALQAGSARAPHSNIFVGRQFAYVQDFDVEVAAGAAVADPVINIGLEGVALDAAVISAGTMRFQTEIAGVRRSLAALTGADPGDTTAAWERWWTEHGAEWRAEPAPIGPSSAPRDPDEVEEGG